MLQGSDLRHCPRCGGFLPVAVENAVDPLIGQPILNGKYRILSVIGEGGMGKVYLAEQKVGAGTRKVAIKTLQPELAGDPQIIARFHREAQTVMELEHPNTIKFYDFDEIDLQGKKLLVVMEFIQGESLAHVLARGAVDVARAERIMAQICGSLQEAHDHGIVHRDLKPENIYLTQKGARGDFVKVLDFGIAKRSDAVDEKEAKLTRQGTVLGTPPYMSPEQFTGQTLDARSDVYALGVIAYEMLSGALPFTGATPWEWATKHLTAAPTPFEMQPGGANVPERHRRAIMRALAKNRDERPASVTQFLQEFAGQSDGAVDWTASSTSLANQGPAPVPAGPASYPGQAPNTGPFGPHGTHPVPTPNPFHPQTPMGGHVAAPSSAGFSAVPSAVGGAPASVPGFAPQPSLQHGGYPSGSNYAAPPPPRKSRVALVVGLVIALVAVGTGIGVSLAMNSEEEDPAPAVPTAQNQVPNVGVPTVQGTMGPNQNVSAPQPASVQGATQIPAPQPLGAVDAGATTATPTNVTQIPPANTNPNPSTTTAERPRTTHSNSESRVISPIVQRGLTAAQANNFAGAVAALQQAASAGDNSGVGRLRSELRRRGQNQINNLILQGDCGAAQQLFRQLRGAGATPSTSSFGDACRAP